MPDASDNAMSPPLLLLHNCASRLANGPWKFIRLRGTETENDLIDVDDVDLLGTRGSAISLMNAAFEWVRSGECHLRIKSGNHRKIGLSLISNDGRHHLHLDLWIELWQIDNRTQLLTYQSCPQSLLDPTKFIQRLPIDLEAAIFVHHLKSKKKNISDPKQIARLENYARACKDLGHFGLAEAIEQTAREATISEATAALTLQLLKSSLGIKRPPRIGHLIHRVSNSVTSAWFKPFRNTRMLGIMGCDGCGKTTLCKWLASHDEAIRGVYTGKHLYRKSIIYKLLVIFVRPLLLQKREKFDDTLSPVAYLLASLRLFVKLLLTPNGIVLIDRSIIDFLMVNRKSDHPRFSRWQFLSAIIGIRLTHVHVIVPFERLRERKLEMTEIGHPIYDAKIFQLMSRRAPSDHIVFNNSMELDQTGEALARILARFLEAATPSENSQSGSGASRLPSASL